jgi:hypothetical protein
MSDVTPLRRLLHLMSQALRRGRRAAQRPRTVRARPRVEALEDRTLPAVVTWISSISGAWDVGSNWSTGRKPGAADDAVIDAPGLTVRHSTGADSVHSITSNGTLELSGGSLGVSSASTLNAFTLDGGTLAGLGDVTVGGLLTWTAGTLSGAGHVAANGGMQISGNGGHTLSGRTLDNAAEADWTGTGGISLTNNATLNNLATGTFFATGDGTLSGSASTFNNAGTFSKTGGSGTTTVSASLINSGTVAAASGTLNVAGRDVATGAFTTAAGATLAFNGGAQAFRAGSSVTGAGDVKFGGATVTVLGSYATTGNTTISNGTVQFDTDTTLPALTFSGGTLGGTATVTVTGALTWTGGTMNGGGRTVANGGMTISGDSPNFKQLSNRTLDNAGTATWTGTGALNMNSNSVWNNLANASLLIQNDAQFGGGNGSQYTGSRFNNAGTFQKTGGTGTTNVLAFVNNSGTVDAASGTLNLADGGFNDATFTVEAGATLGLTGGSQTLDANSGISGAGNVIFGGANVILAGSYSVSGTTTISNGTVSFDGNVTLPALTLSGGTLTGDGDVSVSGRLTWTGGTMTGAGQTDANGDVTISGTGTKALLNGRTLNTSGTTTWTGGDINVLYDAVWNNQSGGVVDARGDNRFGTDSVFHAEGTFNNFGTFKKSAGTGTTYGDIAFNNSGTVEAASGTLDLAGGGISGGTFLADSGAALEFGGGPHFLTATSSVSGDGTVIFDSETFNGLSMTITGSYNVAGTTTFRASDSPFAFPPVEFDQNATMGTLNLTNGTLTGVGDVTVTGTFNWTGGTLSGLGNLIVSGNMTLSGSNGRTLDGRTLQNTGTAAWTDSGGVSFANDAVWVNLSGAVLDVRSTGAFSGTGTFDNQGSVVKTTGTGTAAINVAFYNEGSVDVETGRLNFGRGVTNTGSVTVGTGGTLGVSGSAYLQIGGTTTLNGGTLLAGTVDIEGGVLSGPGTIGSTTALAAVINAGQINAGGAGVTGTLTINGTYTQTAAGTLVLQVGGSTPGTDTDKLAVTGQATLDGSLTVVLLNGFVSGPLQVVTFLSHSGVFASLDGDGSQYTATYSTGALTLT